ncbi:hypothetical protein LTS10_002753 [Elasticomyces elasticus]|nr:hypothetical protein LTS10_002753 [Elasticomyces elasticus]
MKITSAVVLACGLVTPALVGAAPVTVCGLSAFPHSQGNQLTQVKDPTLQATKFLAKKDEPTTHSLMQGCGHWHGIVVCKKSVIPAVMAKTTCSDYTVVGLMLCDRKAMGRCGQDEDGSVFC